MASTRKSTQCAGFTLIEVLASIVILLLIVLAMGRIFASATKSYQSTIRQVERDSASRVVMDYVVSSISQALFENAADNTNALLTMRYEADVGGRIFGWNPDEIWFVGANNDMSFDDPREVRQTVIFIDNYEGITNPPPNAKYRYALWQDYQRPKDGNFWNSYRAGAAGQNWSGEYRSPPSGSGNARQRRAVLLDNVRTLEIFAYATPDGARVSSWDSRGGASGNQSLFCMDIYLETLSEADAIRAAQMAANLDKRDDDPRVIEFIESSVRRNYQRIYFPNKFAYYDNQYP